MEFEKENMQWLEYDLLLEYPNIYSATFLRHGGTSKGAFHSLNASDSVGDHPDCVKVNRELMRKQSGMQQIVFAKQVHGLDICEITSENKHQIPQADVLVTREKHIGLAIMHADCQAAIFYDPDRKAIAVAHAGWRGLVSGIYTQVVSYFKDKLGSNPEHLIVCISPSIGPCHAVLSDYKKEIPQKYWSFQTEPKHFDFWQIAKAQLKDADIAEKNMEIIKTCTFENSKDYFSYRREKITGRHATVAGMIS